MSNRQWYQLHAWAGFAFAGLLLLICASGVLATLSYELQYLSDAKYRALTERQGPVAWSALEQQLAEHYPQGQILGAQVHGQTYLAGEVRLLTDKGFRFVFFDPASGQLLGEGGWGQLSRYLRDLHMYLSMGSTGKYIVTATSLLLLLTLITSFKVYRGWWRQWLALPAKLRWQRRPSWASWHKWLGLWSWWFIAIITLTGLWYLSEHIMLKADIDHYPAAPTASAALPSPQQPLSLTALLQRVQQARPDMDVSRFYYPTYAAKAKQVQPIMAFTGQDGHSLLVRDRANRVYINALSGEVVALQHAEDLGLVARISDTADPLHFGNFAGLGVKLIYALFGLALTFLVLSGMRMHYQRTRRKSPSLARWMGMTGSLSLLVAVLALVYTSVVFDDYTQQRVPLSPQLATLLAH
ncbi:PepSY-associated TM helix domain-containing protein [Idiomarina xiamenensis]|uniref:PepSY-associated TM helix n=1 Tax=Idiomarina xiamenensis 10-D-4 TaxID=740709 RepID=K2KHI4_9GAMM|nr:PepSY-associated TM helix domain-containing protein [Idiomarina xiamenensis]EKE82119.1 PepSY-associated TM helix [Idiomarina xiamenensis 10-D-4]